MAVPLLTYPTDATNTSEDLWKNFPFQPNGVIWPTHGQGYMTVFADSTGLQVKVTTGSVYISNFCADVLTQQVLPIATPNATNPRIDLVVARLDLSGSAASISLVVITGTPGVSPVAPTPTSSDVSLATVRVEPSPNATIVAGKVSTIRAWTGNTSWVNLGNVTVRAAPGDSNTVVDGSITNLSRWRIVNGDLQVNYLVSVSLHGNNPSAIYLGLPNPARSSGSLTGFVGGHAVETTFDSLDQASPTYVRLSLRDLHLLDNTWANPIASGFGTYVYVSGIYELIG